ncbi:MAG TPA: cell envelope integrity protein CreD [Xanthomonadaceae bacterium]|nr:cell envelope integrity protein CreD [Xanthomonadaceae bacterium]
MNPLTRPMSAGVKAFGIGFLALLLCIPLLAVHGLLAEREGRLRAAEQEVARAWGSAQTVGGPLLRVDFRRIETDEQGRRILRERHLTVLPDTLDIATEIGAETRHRGLFQVPVYLAGIRFQGQWRTADLAALTPEEGETLHGAELLLPLADLRGLRSVESFRVGGRVRELEPGVSAFAGLRTLRVPLTAQDIDAGSLPFDFQLTLAGAQHLHFLPLARRTAVEARADWPDPSFEGGFLPAARSIDRDGFHARWQVLELNRGYPQTWNGSGVDQGLVRASAFGVSLYQPAGVYQQNERALKYGFLFVLLTFGAFYLCELLLGLRLHPIQYLLVGAALVAFFLLLLALSEHFAFALAYASASIVLVAMIGGYAMAALAGRRRGALIGAFVATLYAFLFLLIQSESYALLLGALAVMALLAVAMYLTRRVDWYGLAMMQERREA